MKSLNTLEKTFEYSPKLPEIKMEDIIEKYKESEKLVRPLVYYKSWVKIEKVIIIGFSLFIVSHHQQFFLF
jgi:hypothetical protein